VKGLESQPILLIISKLSTLISCSTISKPLFNLLLLLSFLVVGK